MSIFHKEVVEKKETEIYVLERVFSIAHFPLKECIPNRKFLPLINFMTSVIGVEEIRYFQHGSEGSLIDIFFI